MAASPELRDRVQIGDAVGRERGRGAARRGGRARQRSAHGGRAAGARQGRLRGSAAALARDRVQSRARRVPRRAAARAPLPARRRGKTSPSGCARSRPRRPSSGRAPARSCGAGSRRATRSSRGRRRSSRPCGSSVAAEQPLRLVFVTQTIDADDPHLAQTIDLVAALARRCERVAVICDRVRRHDLPANVSFRTFGAPSRVRRTARYLSAVSAELRDRAARAALAHGPDLPRPRRADREGAAGAAAALVHALERRLDAAAGDAARRRRAQRRRAARIPLDSPKVRGIGHAIDLAAFEPRAAAPEHDGQLRLLALGRTQPQKGFVTLLARVRARARAGPRRAARASRPADQRARAPPPRRARGADPGQRDAARPCVGRGRGRRATRVAELIREADAVVNPTRDADGRRLARQGRLRGRGLRRPRDRLQPEPRRLPRRPRARAPLPAGRPRGPGARPARVRRERPRDPRAGRPRAAAPRRGGPLGRVAGRTASSAPSASCNALETPPPQPADGLRRLRRLDRLRAGHDPDRRPLARQDASTACGHSCSG